MKIVDEMAARADLAFVETHGGEGAKLLLAREGIVLAPDVSVDPDSALRFLAAQRVRKVENVTFLEALRMIERGEE